MLIILFISCSKNKGGEKNSPPSIERAEILPVRIYKTTTVTCRVFGKDTDKDNITYKFKWFVNDEEYLEEPEIELKPLSKGDKIYAEITPYDGKEYGKPYRTAEKYIQNSKPKMISARIEPEIVTSTTKEIKIIGNGEDIDGDNISFIYEWYLNNKKLDEKGNVLRGNFKRGEVINFIVYSFDGEERSDNFVSSAIYVQNSAPYFQMKEDSIKISSNNLNLKVEAIDPDGDRIRYSIIFSSLPLVIDENTGVISGEIPSGVDVNVQVKAEDDKGSYSIKYFRLNIR